jgi:hypothetical protein
LLKPVAAQSSLTLQRPRFEEKAEKTRSALARAFKAALGKSFLMGNRVASF